MKTIDTTPSSLAAQAAFEMTDKLGHVRFGAQDYRDMVEIITKHFAPLLTALKQLETSREILWEQQRKLVEQRDQLTKALANKEQELERLRQETE